jgi:hypothetical protein
MAGPGGQELVPATRYPRFAIDRVRCNASVNGVKSAVVQSTHAARARGGLTVTIQSTVGIVANPASARDIRRLVAYGSAFTAHDKVNVLKRIMVGLGRTDVALVLSMTDRGGVSAGLSRAAELASADNWPAIEFIDQSLSGSAGDTVEATRRMIEAGVGAIVVLGGDGTHRLVAAECGTTPLVGLSTGTNNAFPEAVEPTVAGMAAGLVASGHLDVDSVTTQAKSLIVRHRNRQELGLVDVAILDSDRVGSGAVWDPEAISQLFLCFARADAIGLSAIGGHLQPIDRYEPIGLHVELHGHRPEGQRQSTVRAPIGPGLMADVNVASWRKLALDRPVAVAATTGIVSIDGERMFRFGHQRLHDEMYDPADAITVTLTAEGPRMIDVAGALDLAARTGLLTNQSHQTVKPNTVTNHQAKGNP